MKNKYLKDYEWSNIKEMIRNNNKNPKECNEDFDGRLEMARSLQRQHPDVVTITYKWNRWQHQVDYRSFKSNPLIKKKGIRVKKGVHNYGMSLAPRNK